MRTLVHLCAVAAIAACNAYDKDLGPTPFECGPTEPRCPMEYKCVADPIEGEICVSDGSSISGGFECVDDSAIEPNEIITAATMTPVDGMKMHTTEERAICPNGDKDTYAVTIATMNENLEALITFDSDGATLLAAILNSGGVPIASAAGVASMPQTIRAYTQNLSAGTYYVQVYGPNSGLVLNNYKLTLNVTGP